METTNVNIRVPKLFHSPRGGRGKHFIVQSHAGGDGDERMSTSLSFGSGTSVLSLNNGKCSLTVTTDSEGRRTLVARAKEGDASFAGPIDTEAQPENRVLFTSTAFTTPLIISEETDFQETEFKRRNFVGKSVLSDLLDDFADETEETKSAAVAKARALKTLPDPANAFDWGGIFLVNESNDLETVLDQCEVRNAINGVIFLSSSGTIKNSLITNCFGIKSRYF